MPTETWKRATPLPPSVYHLSRKGAPVVERTVGYPEYLDALQVTTSFRTRGDQSHLDVPDTPLELFRSSNMDLSDDLGEDSHLPYSKGYAGRDTGHPFVTQRNSIGLSHPNVTVRGSQGSFYQGPVNVPGGGWPAIPNIESDLYGSRAIAATVPTKSIGNLSTALGEIIRDGFPRLGLISMPQRVSDFRKLGDDYLNVEFGWKPFLADIQDLAYAVKNSAKILEQYQRDSGRVVRRRFAFPATETETLVDTQDGWKLDNGLNTDSSMNDLFIRHPDYPSLDAGIGRRVLTRSTYERYSFSGGYSYYLAPDDNAMNQIWRSAQLADKLLGFGITPATLWELAPWSWLVDWVTNIGSIVNNASLLAKDGLVIRWGYLQRHTVYVSKTTIEGIRFYSGPHGPFTMTYRSNRKERVKATPFGFGLDTDDFTVRQWAILAALGMTKSPRIAF